MKIKVSDDAFPDACEGDNMPTCRDAIIDAIKKLTGVDEDRLSPLKLENGAILCSYYDLILDKLVLLSKCFRWQRVSLY